MPNPILRRRIAGGGILQPTQVPGLHLWLKADAITGLADGAAVSSWTDSSGNGRDAAQATGSLQPLFKTGIQNGKPVVRFDGVDDFLQTGVTGLTVPFTYLVVARYRSVRVANDTLLDGRAANVGRTFRAVGNSTNRIQTYSGVFGPSVDATVESWHVYALVSNGTSTEISADSGAPSTGNSGASTNANGITLGATGAGSEPGPVDIGELVVYSGVLPFATRLSLVAYLRARWGTP